jgi:hypothetical protein
MVKQISLALLVIEFLSAAVLFESENERAIFRAKREEVIGGWRKVHNEEISNLYFTQIIIISAIKARRMKWTVNKISL